MPRAEYIHGERNDTISGDTFDGNRIQFAAQLNFCPMQYTLPVRGQGHTVMTRMSVMHDTPVHGQPAPSIMSGNDCRAMSTSITSVAP